MSEEELNKITWEEYKRLIEESEITYNELQEAKKEIERLTNQNKALNEMYELTKKEYIRLNNIINEFNKLIENEINESKLEDDYDRVDALEYCLATLKELKGSDKE